MTPAVVPDASNDDDVAGVVVAAAASAVDHNTQQIYSVRQKKVSPKVICHFLSNHLEF